MPRKTAVKFSRMFLWPSAKPPLKSHLDAVVTRPLSRALASSTSGRDPVAGSSSGTGEARPLLLSVQFVTLSRRRSLFLCSSWKRLRPGVGA